MQKISYKGRQLTVRSIALGSLPPVVLRGRLLKIGELFDEIWIPSREVPDLQEVVRDLRKVPGRPDLFTSAQRFPDTTPRYPFYHEWDNIAVASFDSYADWYEKKIDRSARKQVRQTRENETRTDVIPFSDDLVSSICSIYNEVQVRQGKKFWHYGKDFDTVRAENATYLDRSLFIGTYLGDELIGFLKMVMDGEVASMMQIISKSAHFSKRPNNALLSKAVEVCVREGARYLTYGKFAYGKKGQSSLSEFKKSHGFNKFDVPRYYVPLTLWGRIGLKLGLHRDFRERLPAPVSAGLVRLRARLYKLRAGRS
jgi:hypothetical protein